MLVDIRSAQSALKAAGFYTGQVDGSFGPASRRAGLLALRSLGVAADAWSQQRQDVAIGQWFLRTAGFDTGIVDGYSGPSTLFALEKWQDAQREFKPPPSQVAHQSKDWPRQAGMEAFYGKPGTNHITLTLPFPMRIAWDLKTSISKININKGCAQSAGRIFTRVLAKYGYDRLVELNLDRYGGCYANRPMRGGVSLSTHAYACALDIDPENNQLRWGSDRAAMARPECSEFVDAFEAEGWVSLGRERNYDWMHFQAARF